MQHPGSHLKNFELYAKRDGKCLWERDKLDLSVEKSTLAPVGCQIVRGPEWKQGPFRSVLLIMQGNASLQQMCGQKR